MNHSAGEEQSNPVKVRLMQPEKRLFTRQIRIQGNIQPSNHALLSAKVSGTIESLNVEEGVRVKQGDVLFQIDKENLQNLLKEAEDAYRVLSIRHKTTESDVEIAKTNLEKAGLDYQRDKELFSINAVSANSYEQKEVSLKNNQQNLQKANISHEYSKVLVEQAATLVKIAQKNLNDSVAVAPYNGVITSRLKREGEFVGAGTPILKIESEDNLELTARLSAIYYSSINEKTQIEIFFKNKMLCKTSLSYISPNVDPVTRTFEIKAKLPQETQVTSGLLCDINIILAQRDGIGVPQNSLIARTGGKNVVFTVDQNKQAKEIPVQPGFSTDGYVEILNPDVLSGYEVVVLGQYFLNDGNAVEIIKE